MSVELIGMIGVQREAGARGATVHVIGGGVDPAYLRDFALAHEKAGFDTVLVGYTSTSAEGFMVASYAASVTEHLRFLIAHRPGFVAPTLAARKAATLDHFTGGRIALHIISGGSDVEQSRDGDWLDHDAGATTLLMRGFDPLNDAREFGEELIPLVRAEAARRHTAAALESSL